MSLVIRNVTLEQFRKSPIKVLTYKHLQVIRSRICATMHGARLLAGLMKVSAGILSFSYTRSQPRDDQIIRRRNHSCDWSCQSNTSIEDPHNLLMLQWMPKSSTTQPLPAPLVPIPPHLVRALVYPIELLHEAFRLIEPDEPTLVIGLLSLDG